MYMANRIRSNDEKIEYIQSVFDRINIAKEARETGVPESTIRYDLNKIRSVLPMILKNKKPGPESKKSEQKEKKTRK